MDCLLQQITRFETTALNAQRFLDAYPTNKASLNIEDLLHTVSNESKRGLDSFTMFYAHGECAVYAEGLIDSIPSVYSPKLVVFFEEDCPIHYAVQAQFDGSLYYFDAYGVFSNIEAIKARYTNNTVTSTSFISLDSEDPKDESIIENWRNQTVSFLDCFDDDYSAELHDMHYTEMYEEYLATVVANNFKYLAQININ